jgi:hypothetical protein
MPLSAQEQESNYAPHSFDFYSDLRCDDAMARLDNFAIHLQMEPEVQAYILGYNGRKNLPGRVLSHLSFAKSYLTDVRGIAANRIVAISAGYREDLTVVLWAMPKGLPPPTPSPTIQVKADASHAPRLFDDGFVDASKFKGQFHLIMSEMCSLESPDLSEYAQLLRKEPDARGYFIVYGSRRGGAGKARLITRFLKAEMTKNYMIEPRRIVTVYGGLLPVYGAMELWVVPKGALVPKPSPKTYLKRQEALGN